jgi:hypothetical protein
MRRVRGLPLSTELSGRSVMFQALLLYGSFARAAHLSNTATLRHEDLFEYLEDAAWVIDIYAPLLDSRRLSEIDDISRGRGVSGSLFEYG